MILLSLLINRYRAELERTHGHELLPSHRQALQAMARCRQQGSDLMVLECKNCQKTIKVPHSCGHRSRSHCQHFESQQWIERQTAKLLPVPYFLLTFTVPYELRDWFWEHQRTAYDLLLRTVWLTVQAFGRGDPKLNGQMGAHAVLHTHNRRLEYHPHVHLIVSAGAVSKQQEQWRCKRAEYHLPVVNLSLVYRAKWFSAIIQTLPDAEFLWLLLRHVLPKRFRRVRDFGLLHGNAKAVIQLLQMLLSHIPFCPMSKAEKQPMACPECGQPIRAA
jgi:hypothetical protein